MNFGLVRAVSDGCFSSACTIPPESAADIFLPD
jgi:hypothetical protein